MILPITLTIAGAAAILHIWLSLRVGRLRRPLKIGVGDGGNEVLLRRMRAHANFAENMPIFLILLGLIELAGGDRTIWLWAAGIALHPRPHRPRLRHGPARRPTALRVVGIGDQLARPARPRRLGAELSPIASRSRRATSSDARPRGRMSGAGLHGLGPRQHPVGDERVGAALLAEGAHRAVAGDEGGVVAQRPEPPGDRVDQVLMVAHREIGAADRALEQDVADDRELRGGMVEDDMAGRVAGAMIDVEGQLADRHLIAIDQPAVGFERSCRVMP